VPDLNRREVRTTDAPSPAFSYSQGMTFGNLLFIAGQVPRHPTTREVPATLADQVRQTLDNLTAVAVQAGTSLRHALRVNVYLDDLSCIEEFDEVYRRYFTEPYPVRTTVQAGLRGYLVEIDAIVAIEKEGTS
jgi:reactive intermediate/imine deaminase